MYKENEILINPLETVKDMYVLRFLPSLNIKKMIVNGLDFDLDKFNGTFDNGSYTGANNNCYTYAINQRLNPYTKIPYESYGYCQPFNLGGKKKRPKLKDIPDFLYNYISVEDKEWGEDVESFIEANKNEYISTKSPNIKFFKPNMKKLIGAKIDLDRIGYDFILTNYESVHENPKAWKVCFLSEPYETGDYHWMRQNSDGTWSHKQGNSYVSDRDAKGKTIKIPHKSNMGRYSIFMGYFFIVPRDNAIIINDDNNNSDKSNKDYSNKRNNEELVIYFNNQEWVVK